MNNILNASVKRDNNTIKANLQTSDNKIAGVNNIPSATETVKGLVRFATENEATEGNSKICVISPHSLKKVNNITQLSIDEKIEKITHDEGEEMQGIIEFLDLRTSTFIDLNE